MSRRFNDVADIGHQGSRWKIKDVLGVSAAALKSTLDEMALMVIGLLGIVVLNGF